MDLMLIRVLVCEYIHTKDNLLDDFLSTYYVLWQLATNNRCYSLDIFNNCNNLQQIYRHDHMAYRVNYNLTIIIF